VASGRNHGRHSSGGKVGSPLDGIYVIRTTIPEKTLDAAGVVTAYKNLVHVFIVMLAAYLTWQLRRTLAPLTFTDQTPPERTPLSPPRPARTPRPASPHAAKTTPTGQSDRCGPCSTTWAP